jgi:Pyruvate/2-oxoacid:ferredoxin oxidoreductase delta subunit
MKQYNKIQIYFMSGTGNALTACLWIREYAEKQDIETSIVHIDRFDKNTVLEAENTTLTGFAYPAHGFSLPWYMLKFIVGFPRGRNKDFFLLNTRAGMKMSRLFLPGLSGLAMWLPLFILTLKGYKIKGLLPLDMPSNWISIHPGIRRKIVDSIIGRCKRITVNFTKNICTGKKAFRPMLWIELPFDIAVAPISLGYFLIGRFFLAKTFIASYQCNNCGICIEYCPVGAIKMHLGRPFWTFNCESCMRCMNNCPKKAIQTSHLFAFMMIWTVSLFPLTDMLMEYILKNSAPWVHIFSGLIDLTIVSAFNIPLLFITYWLLHILLLIKPVNMLFTYTSLTRWWRRYKVPGLNVKDYHDIK